jgi:hypothetical protein
MAQDQPFCSDARVPVDKIKSTLMSGVFVKDKDAYMTNGRRRGLLDTSETSASWLLQLRSNVANRTSA